MDHETTPSDGEGPQVPPRGLPDTPDQAAEQVAPEDEPSRVEYLKNMLPPSKQSHAKRKWPLIVLLVIVVAALAGGGVYLYLSKHNKSQVNSKSHAASKSNTVKPSLNQVAAGNAHYVSNGQDLNLDFDYPSNWTAAPTSGNNSNDQTITLNSPLTTIAGADGSSQTGKVTLTIRPGSAQLSELNNHDTAAQASAQFAYSKPTSAQHQYPYLTFLHFGSGNTSSFSEVLVTGTLQFPQGTNLVPSDVTVDPIISASFFSCSDTACAGSGAAPLSVTNATWQNATVFQQTLGILESMQLN